MTSVFSGVVTRKHTSYGCIL